MKIKRTLIIVIILGLILGLGEFLANRNIKDEPLIEEEIIEEEIEDIIDYSVYENNEIIKVYLAIDEEIKIKRNN